MIIISLITAAVYGCVWAAINIDSKEWDILYINTYLRMHLEGVFYTKSQIFVRLSLRNPF